MKLKGIPQQPCAKCNRQHVTRISCRQAETLELRMRIAALEADKAELLGLVQTWRQIASARG